LLATLAKSWSWCGGEEEAIGLSLSVEDFGDWRRKVLLILLGNWEWRRCDCDNNISQLSYGLFRLGWREEKQCCFRETPRANQSLLFQGIYISVQNLN
jgi:hypothetical protein